MSTSIGVGGVVMLFVIAMSVSLLVFWIWMLIDLIFKQREDKFVWFLVLFFLNIIGALAYYFVARKKRIAAITVATPA